jgi:hypothetical protein
MSGAMADQFQKQQCNGSLSEGGFNNLSPEATQYNALRDLGMKDEHILKVLQEKYENDTSLYGPKEAQGTSSKETSQPTEKPSSLRVSMKNKVKIAKLQALMDKIKAHPEGRKLLEEKRQHSESERRRLDNPPIPVSNPECLDVSNSQAQVTVEPVNPQDNPVPGTETRVDFFLNVRNGCPVVADTVAYDLTVTATCTEGLPPTATRTAKIAANPSTVGIGENSGMTGPQSMIARCTTYDDYGQPIASAPVDSITATVQADGYNQIGGIQELFSPSYTIPLKH